MKIKGDSVMKKYLIVVIFIVSICCNLFLANKLFSLGSESEKVKILNATIWQLSREGYKENQIEEMRIRYNPIKGGVMPYKVFVVFKSDTSTARIYSWTSTEEKQVEDIGKTTL